MTTPLASQQARCSRWPTSLGGWIFLKRHVLCEIESGPMWTSGFGARSLTISFGATRSCDPLSDLPFRERPSGARRTRDRRRARDILGCHADPSAAVYPQPNSQDPEWRTGGTPPFFASAPARPRQRQWSRARIRKCRGRVLASSLRSSPRPGVKEVAAAPGSQRLRCLVREPPKDQLCAIRSRPRRWIPSRASGPTTPACPIAPASMCDVTPGRWRIWM